METKAGVLLNTQHPHAVLNVVTQLSQIRTAIRLGLQLNQKFPTTEAWMEFLSQPETLETIDAFAQIIEDVRTAAEFGPSMTPETFDRAVRQHQARALDAVQEFAELVEAQGEDVLAFLVNA